MFNVLDQKQTWIGISAEVDSSAVLNKRELLEKSKTTDVPVFVLGFASSWTGPEKSEQRSNKRQKTDTGPVAKNDTDGDHGGGTLFALVPWNFLNDFKLHFYGSVGLEGRGTSVPVARVKESGGASLPWQIFSGGYDSWMGSEMVCLAWMVPLVKGTKAGKKVKTGQVIGSSSKHGKQASTDPAASTEQSGQKDGCSGQAAYEAMAAQAMGLAKGGAKGKRKPKKKAAKKENESDLITDFIQFIEAPLLFGWICEACQLVYDDSEKIKIHLRGSSALSVNFPKLVVNHTALDSASWTLDETDTETAKTKAGGFYIPVQKNGDDWYVCLNRGPGERLKLAEKSTEEEDVNLMEKHNQELLGWGNLPIWQGSIDVVTTHLGTENSSARAGRGSKVSKEVKHLMA
ncbi:unnamed protein product [Durusdinium trenchii]|uniref:Uncharacterized protein n=1 Tax=Durusdinium trenchii TaxID=1381693 RepID=A0ABP0SEI9_9DINO